MASVERQLGRKPKTAKPEVEDVECPPLLAHLWDWFVELANRRTYHGMGPNPIVHSEIIAWSILTRRHVRVDEVRLLIRLDDCWMNAHAPEAKA